MIMIHAAILAGVIFLWIGGRLGWVHWSNYMEKQEYHRILLIILV